VSVISYYTPLKGSESVEIVEARNFVFVEYDELYLSFFLKIK